MRYLFGVLCVCALGVIPLVGCSETGGDGGSGGTAGTGGNGACVDWAGEWTLSSISCDGVPHDASGVDYTFAADCTGEMVFTGTCETTTQLTFIPQAGGTIIFDAGAITCSAGCTDDECQPTADAGQPYTGTLVVTDNAWTYTALVTAQMVSDELTPCQAGETMVAVAVPR
jgi:hypothetical protein